MFTTPRAMEAMIGRTGCHCVGRGGEGRVRVCGGSGGEGEVEGQGQRLAFYSYIRMLHDPPPHPTVTPPSVQSGSSPATTWPGPRCRGSGGGRTRPLGTLHRLRNSISSTGSCGTGEGRGGEGRGAVVYLCWVGVLRQPARKTHTRAHTRMHAHTHTPVNSVLQLLNWLRVTVFIKVHDVLNVIHSDNTV